MQRVTELPGAAVQTAGAFAAAAAAAPPPWPFPVLSASVFVNADAEIDSAFPYRQLVSDAALTAAILADNKDAIKDPEKDVMWTEWVTFCRSYLPGVNGTYTPTPDDTRKNGLTFLQPWPACRVAFWPAGFPKSQGVYEVGIRTPDEKTIVPVNIGITDSSLYKRLGDKEKYLAYKWIFTYALERRFDIVVRWCVLQKDVVSKDKAKRARREQPMEAEQFASLSPAKRLESFLLDRYRWCCNNHERRPATPTQRWEDAAHVIVRERTVEELVKLGAGADKFLRVGDFPSAKGEKQAAHVRLESDQAAQTAEVCMQEKLDAALRALDIEKMLRAKADAEVFRLRALTVKLSKPLRLLVNAMGALSMADLKDALDEAAATEIAFPQHDGYAWNA